MFSKNVCLILIILNHFVKQDGGAEICLGWWVETALFYILLHKTVLIIVYAEY